MTLEEIIESFVVQASIAANTFIIGGNAENKGKIDLMIWCIILCYRDY